MSGQRSRSMEGSGTSAWVLCFCVLLSQGGLGVAGCVGTSLDTGMTLATGCGQEPTIGGPLVAGQVVQVKFTHPVTGRCRQAAVRLPNAYDGQTLFPVVLYSHGSISKSRIDVNASTVYGQPVDSWLAMIAQNHLAAFADGALNDYGGDAFHYYLVATLGDMSPASGLRWETWDGESGCAHDVDYVKTLVGALIAKLPIDQTRVFTTGHSSGASFSFRLSFQASDLLLAAAARAGRLWGPSAWNPVAESIAEKTCMPFFYQYGKLDTHPYEGSDTCLAWMANLDPLCRKFGIEASAIGLAVANGCDAPYSGADNRSWMHALSMPPTTGNFRGHAYDRYDFANCDRGSKVRFQYWEDQAHSFSDVQRQTWRQAAMWFASIDPTTTCRSNTSSTSTTTKLSTSAGAVVSSSPSSTSTTTKLSTSAGAVVSSSPKVVSALLFATALVTGLPKGLCSPV